MLRSIAAIALVVPLCVPAVRAADPPRPNPENPVDYVKWMNEQYGKDVTRNAAGGYLRAIAAFEKDDDLLDYATKTDVQKWTSLPRSKLAKLIEANAKCLGEYAAAARTPECYFAHASSGGSVIETLLPELQDIPGVAKLTAARARLRLLAGDVDGATDDAATLLFVGRHMQEQPFLIQYLWGMVVSALGYDVLLDFPLLAPSADFESVLAKLEKADRAPMRPFRQLACEKVSAWDAAQRFLRDTDGDGRYEQIDAALGLGSSPEQFDKPQRFDEIVKGIDDLYESLRDVFVADYAESKERAAAIEQRTASQSGTFVAAFIPSMTRVAVILRRVIAIRHAYRVVFYLHAYHAKHDKWPQTLADALPKSEAGRLIDPFSNAPFGYRLVDGNPLLYTVGENGKDDGGQVYRENGKPAWGNTGDYIYYPRATE